VRAFLAADTIRSIADQAPEAALRDTFLAWTLDLAALRDLSDCAESDRQTGLDMGARPD
jgi:hypothetical protein